MSELNRTIAFVGAAVFAVGLAAYSEYASRPKPLEGYEQVGDVFFEDFTDPNEAKELRVVAYDADTASVEVFGVEFKDGRWRIPSHHNYPADAEDRLAKTAASVIGVKRGALVSRRPTDHERFGVIDPLDDSVTDLQGRGQRITLKAGDESVLADFIIGNKVEDQENTFYIRRPDEAAVYRTRLDINLSTRFADWIEQDLLQVDPAQLVRVDIDKYSIDEQQLRIVGRDFSKLTRDSASDPWQLEGLNPETEQLKTSAVNQLVNSIDGLKIVGVRPKPPGLTPDLEVDPSIARNPLALEALQADMQRRGFLIAQDTEGKRQLVSNEGGLRAATDQGIRYHLYFGEIFTGSNFEIEIGSSAEKEKDGADSPEAGEEAKDDKQNEGKKSRYLFVRAEFDHRFLGKKPVEPTKPTPPPEKPKEDSNSKPDSAAEENKDKEKKDAAEKTDNKTENAADEQEQTEKAQPEKSAYDQAVAKYEEDLAAYKLSLADYEKKTEAGKKLSQELNDRFARWYYVISATSFEDLRLGRAALVEPKDMGEAQPQIPGLPGTAPATPPATTPPSEANSSKPAEASKPAPPTGDKPAESKDASVSTSPEKSAKPCTSP